jgi:hypothetical protein
VVGEVTRRNETHVAQLTGVGPEKEKLLFSKWNIFSFQILIRVGH